LEFLNSTRSALALAARRALFFVVVPERRGRYKCSGPLSARSTAKPQSFHLLGKSLASLDPVQSPDNKRCFAFDTKALLNPDAPCITGAREKTMDGPPAAHRATRNGPRHIPGFSELHSFCPALAFPPRRTIHPFRSLVAHPALTNYVPVREKSLCYHSTTYHISFTAKSTLRTHLIRGYCMLLFIQKKKNIVGCCSLHIFSTEE
jgi:hypothetical protein